MMASESTETPMVTGGMTTATGRGRSRSSRERKAFPDEGNISPGKALTRKEKRNEKSTIGCEES